MNDATERKVFSSYLWISGTDNQKHKNMRTFFIALATICRFFTQDIWEKKPARNAKTGKKLVTA